MVVKTKEYFEKTRHVKKKNKSKKYILRGRRNTRCHEKILSNKKKSYNFTINLQDYNRYRAENFNVYLTFNGLSNDVSLIFVAQNFIISICLRYVDISCFCQFSRRLY